MSRLQRVVGWLAAGAIVLALGALPLAASAQESLQLKLRRTFGYSWAGDIQGSFLLIAEGPDELRQVTFHVDDGELETVSSPPFQARLHTGDYPLGPHRLWADGTLTDGSQVISNEITAEFVAAGASGQAAVRMLTPVLLIVGLVGYAGWVELPPGLAILQHPFVLIAAGVMFLVEFVADKVPGVDTLWDGIQTFIRIPAGAALAAGVFGGMDSAAWTTAAAILGGTLAATSHFTKAGARAAANTSPEPFSNVALSVAEDVAVGGLLWLVLTYPWVAAAIVAVLVLLSIWLLPKVFRFVRRLLQALFGSEPPPAARPPSAQ